MRLLSGCLMLLTLAARGGELGPADRPPGVNEKLWARMVEIDARGGTVADLDANFTQEKFTPLLKKPLVSTGRILIKGSAALWTTLKPEPSVLRIDDKEVRLFYPRQKVMEIYKTDQKMGSLAASPFPRLAVLKKHFTFEQVPAKTLLPGADEEKYLSLKMKPVEAELAKHIDQVTVVLEAASGLVMKAETIDGDGDRVVLSFSDIKTNTHLQDRDLQMEVPAGVTISRPLESGGSKPEAGPGK